MPQAQTSKQRREASIADQSQTDKNTADIAEIKTDLRIIKDNHLAHLEADMGKQSSKLDSMDRRLWWVLTLLVATSVVGVLGERIFNAL